MSLSQAMNRLSVHLLLQRMAEEVQKEQAMIFNSNVMIPVDIPNGTTLIKGNGVTLTFREGYCIANYDYVPDKQQDETPKPKKPNNYFREQGNRKHWGK